jgi:hypothetical protein
MKRFFSPVQAFLEQAFLEVSKADGKPGLSVADIQVVLNKVENARYQFTDEGAGQLRAQYVRTAMERLFPGKFAPWLGDVLVWIVYALAKRKGIV